MAKLVRHVQSENHYARICGCGKLIWQSLKIDRISVARLRLGDFHKEERQRAAARTAIAPGKMIFADALRAYRERLKGDHSLKDRSKSYREERITAFPYRTGIWQESQELIEASSDGAVARKGQYQVIFADNLNRAGLIDMQTLGGKRLRSNIPGLMLVMDFSRRGNDESKRKMGFSACQ